MEVYGNYHEDYRDCCHLLTPYHTPDAAQDNKESIIISPLDGGTRGSRWLHDQDRLRAGT